MLADEARGADPGDLLPSAADGGHAERRPLSADKLAEIEAQASTLVTDVNLGEGPDPALAAPGEALMNADVVCVEHDEVLVPAKLPEGVSEHEVVKTLIEPRMRYDFAVTVTQVRLDVEKKVVVSKDGERRVLSGDTHEHGPKGIAVTWQALATLAVLVGQFALPLHRLGTMLSTASKKFTSTTRG